MQLRHKLQYLLCASVLAQGMTGPGPPAHYALQQEVTGMQTGQSWILKLLKRSPESS